MVQEPETLVHRPVQQCMLCGKTSPQVYAHVWMCLDSACAAFFHSSEPPQNIPQQANGEQSSANDYSMVDVHTPAPPRILNYHSAFLAPVPDPGVIPKNAKIMPGNPAEDMARGRNEGSNEGTGTATEFTKGFHCVACGRLSCRWLWRCWACPTCGKELHSPMGVQATKDLWKELNLGTADKPQTWSIEDSRKFSPSFYFPPDLGAIHLHSVLTYMTGISFPEIATVRAQDGDGILRRETFLLPDDACAFCFECQSTILIKRPVAGYIVYRTFNANRASARMISWRYTRQRHRAGRWSSGVGLCVRISAAASCSRITFHIIVGCRIMCVSLCDLLSSCQDSCISYSMWVVQTIPSTGMSPRKQLSRRASSCMSG